MGPSKNDSTTVGRPRWGTPPPRRRVGTVEKPTPHEGACPHEEGSCSPSRTSYPSMLRATGTRIMAKSSATTTQVSDVARQLSTPPGTDPLAPRRAGGSVFRLATTATGGDGSRKDAALPGGLRPERLRGRPSGTVLVLLDQAARCLLNESCSDFGSDRLCVEGGGRRFSLLRLNACLPKQPE